MGYKSYIGYLVMGIALVASTASAQLTATVHPGYSFSDGERPTTDTLNQLGQPSIDISGTVSGTVGLAAGSVTGTILSDTVPDGRTLDYTNESPRKLEVKANGVGPRELAQVLGPNLINAPGGGVTVTNLANTNIAANAAIDISKIAHPSSSAGGFTLSAGAILTVTNFVAGGYPVGGAIVFGTNHGFSATPTWVRVTLVETNVAGDLGWAQGDEVETPGSAGLVIAGADATKCYVASAPGVMSLPHKNNSPAQFDGITSSKWTMKIYARP